MELLSAKIALRERVQEGEREREREVNVEGWD